MQRIRLPEDLFGRAVQRDDAVIQHENPIRVAQGALGFLRRHHDRHAVLPGEICQHAEDRGLAGRVQAGRRLIQHERLRLHRQDGGNRDPLFLAAGKEQGRAVAVIGQPGDVQRPRQPFCDFARRDAQVFGAEDDLIIHAGMDQLHFGVLKDHAGERREHRHRVLFRIQALHPHIPPEDAPGRVWEPARSASGRMWFCPRRRARAVRRTGRAESPH